jgi:hypothetical protein
MAKLLAYAESGDPNGMNLVIILGGVGIVAAAALLAFALILIAKARRHPYAELITVVTVFWALITAGSLMYTANARSNWSNEYTLRLESGYLDPQNTSDQPKLPWAIWTGLGVIYGTMMIWTLIQKRAAPPRE